jgi:hypothetical protein
VTRRQARRKLGSRTHRRANTNGKFIPGTGGGGKKRMLAYRFPRPAKRLGPAVRRALAAS